jgi:hypothetical protein
MSPETPGVAENKPEGPVIEEVRVATVSEAVVPAEAREALVAAGGEVVPLVAVNAEQLGESGELLRVLSPEELPSEDPNEVLHPLSDADIKELDSLDAGLFRAEVAEAEKKPEVEIQLVNRLAGYAQARALGRTRVKLLPLEKVREAVSVSVKNLVEKKGDEGKKALSIFARAVNGIWAFRRTPATTTEQKRQRKSLMSILDQFRPVRVLTERSQAALWKIEKEMAGELDLVLKSNEAVFGVVKNFRSSGSAGTDIEALKEQISDALGSAGIPDNFRGSKEKTEAFFGNILYRAMQEEQELPERNEAKIAALRVLITELKSPLFAKELKGSGA